MSEYVHAHPYAAWNSTVRRLDRKLFSASPITWMDPTILLSATVLQGQEKTKEGMSDSIEDPFADLEDEVGDLMSFSEPEELQ